jgi:hypothetical protein
VIYFGGKGWVRLSPKKSNLGSRIGVSPAGTLSDP